MRIIRPIPLSVIAALALACFTYQSSGQTATPALSDITISLKLDPRLSGATYGGERWISSPTYTGASAQDAVEAKAMGVGLKGEPVRISPKWTPSDSAMVTVSPAEGEQVKITVKSAGESKLEIETQGISKTLVIKGEYRNRMMQFQITQLAAEKTAPPPPSPKAEARSNFKDEKARISYALGMNLGNRMHKEDVEIDPDLLLQGFKDALAADNVLLTDDEVQGTLHALTSRIKARRMSRSKENGEAFLAENKKKEGVLTLRSGLQYRVLKAGSGVKPTLNDIVLLNYRAMLVDGKEFDSSYKRQRPMKFAVKKVIRGWSEALQSMPVGSRWQLFVPSDLAYGARAVRGKIPSNATLVFDVELLSIQNTAVTEDDGAVIAPLPVNATRRATEKNEEGP